MRLGIWSGVGSLSLCFIFYTVALHSLNRLLELVEGNSGWVEAGGELLMADLMADSLNLQ